eukprot:gene14515-16662_t
MWRASLGRSIREVRFVLKQDKIHHGMWRFVETKMPSLRELNQNTFFSVAEIPDDLDEDSGMHLIFGDANDNEELILSDEVSCEEVEKLLKEKVEYGLTLNRFENENNDDLELPSEIVESQNYVRHYDEAF